MTGRRTHSPAHTRTVKCTRARPMSPAAPLLKTKVWAICGLAAPTGGVRIYTRTTSHAVCALCLCVETAERWRF